MPTGTAAPPDECAAIQYSKAMQHWERGRGMQNPKGMMQHLLKVQHSNTASRVSYSIAGAPQHHMQKHAPAPLQTM